MSENTHLPKTHLLYGKTIAIIGGGPAGLTLARLLQLQGIAVKIFERDAGPNARLQGGSLDLHVKSGQFALQRCGLEGQFAAFSRPEGQASKVADKHGHVLASWTAEDEAEIRPEIDRGALLELLRNSLAEGTVNWSRSLAEVVAEDDGRQRLVFASGETFLANLVVGADGLRSKVRQTITPIAAAYTGVTFIEARLSNVDMRHSAIAQFVGPGNVLALGDNKGLLAQRNGDGSIRVYVGRRMPEQALQQLGFDPADPTRARAQLLDGFPDWSPELTGMVRNSDTRFLTWPLYAVPADQTWETRAGLTIIGDAAHVMPPFLGAGANMAMLDAVELVDHLVSDRFAGLSEAIAAFENGMRERMAPLVQESVATQDVLFADDAPAGLLAQINTGEEQ